MRKKLEAPLKPEELHKRFTYHPPFGNQASRYVLIRDTAHSFANLINEETPESREQSLAITALEECVFWANAAIARNEQPANEHYQAPETPDEWRKKELLAIAHEEAARVRAEHQAPAIANDDQAELMAQINAEAAVDRLLEGEE
jgi:hypothetical protein